MNLLRQCYEHLRERCMGRGDFDNLPVAVIYLDAQGQLQRVNRGWEHLSGCRALDCLGRAHDEFLHIEDRALWRMGLQTLAEGGESWVCSLRYPQRNGELCWAEVRLGRRPGGYVATLADISTQVPQHQQLQARHRSLSNLLNGLPLMVYRCRNNRHWSMEYVSAGSLELTGYPSERFIDSCDLTYDSLIHPLDREHVWCSVQEGLRGSRPFAFDYRLLCADGREKWVSERGRGIYSDLGEVLGLEGVVMEQMAQATRDTLLAVGF